MSPERPELEVVGAQLEALLDAGGAVMWPLFGVALLLWIAIVLRAMLLRRARRLVGAPTASPEALVRQRQVRLNLRQLGAFADALVAAAPLLGLLGTVTGMITTFEGLTTMELFADEGGIAGGISVALITTEAGLVVAIPAFFANRLLGRRVQVLEQRLAAPPPPRLARADEVAT